MAPDLDRYEAENDRIFFSEMAKLEINARFKDELRELNKTYQKKYKQPLPIEAVRALKQAVTETVYKEIERWV